MIAGDRLFGPLADWAISVAIVFGSIDLVTHSIPNPYWSAPLVAAGAFVGLALLADWAAKQD